MLLLLYLLLLLSDDMLLLLSVDILAAVADCRVRKNDAAVQMNGTYDLMGNFHLVWCQAVEA